MANAPSTSMPGADADRTIEALLQQRTQYEHWLSRLDSAVENAPTAVRDRVRADYENRLRRVIDDLRGHAATIARELEQHRAVERELNVERQKVEEALAEAEVRHIVGEYSDDEWSQLSGENQHRVDGLREELRTVGAEIARLAEVQTLIGAPTPASAPARTRDTVTPPAPTPVMQPVTPPTQLEIEAPVAVPVPTPVATTPPPVRQAERQAEPVVTASPLDELAFLRSVSDDERKPAPSPAPPRRSSGAGAAQAKSAEPAPVPSVPAPAAPTTAGKTTGMAKTLKCNECGTFNRPTEWYCERCGAELAAL